MVHVGGLDKKEKRKKYRMNSARTREYTCEARLSFVRIYYRFARKFVKSSESTWIIEKE